MGHVLSYLSGMGCGNSHTFPPFFIPPDQYLLSGGEGGYRGRFGAPDTSAGASVGCHDGRASPACRVALGPAWTSHALRLPAPWHPPRFPPCPPHKYRTAEIHALVESLHDDVEAEESSVRWVGSSLDQSGESGGSGEVVSRAAARPDNGPGEPGRAPPGGAGAGDMSAPTSSSGGNAGSEARRQASSGAIGRGAEPGGEAVDTARPNAALARRGRRAVILTSLDDSE